MYLKLLRELYPENEIYQTTDSKFMVIFPNTDIHDVTDKIVKTLDVLKRPMNVKENNIYVTTKVVVYDILTILEGAPKFCKKNTKVNKSPIKL